MLLSGFFFNANQLANRHFCKLYISQYAVPVHHHNARLKKSNLSFSPSGQIGLFKFNARENDLSHLLSNEVQIRYFDTSESPSRTAALEDCGLRNTCERDFLSGELVQFRRTHIKGSNLTAQYSYDILIAHSDIYNSDNFSVIKLIDYSLQSMRYRDLQIDCQNALSSGTYHSVTASTNHYYVLGANFSIKPLGEQSLEFSRRLHVNERGVWKLKDYQSPQTAEVK